jgi:DNA repair ATPase RecN
MGKATLSVEALKEAVFRHVELCRQSLKEGNANLAGLEEGVRSYCEAVANLPKDKGQGHAAELESLMAEIEALNSELAHMRDSVKAELSGLSRVRQANVAYHKSDAMGPVYRLKNEDE